MFLPIEHFPKVGASGHDRLTNKEELSTFSNDVQTHNVSTAASALPSRGANVTSENTVDILPANGCTQIKKGATADDLPSNSNVPKDDDASNEKHSGSDEFDFDDHEPDIGCFHGNDEKSSDRLIQSKNTDYGNNERLVSGELINRAFHCGHIFQAQRNPYIRQLVQHKSVEKGEEFI